MLENRVMAGPILSESLRQNRRLGSRTRILAGDILLGLIRHERALMRIHKDPLQAWVQLTSDTIPALDEPQNAYAIALSLPDDLAAEWLEQLGPGATIEMARIISSRAPVFLRILKQDSLVSLPVPVVRLGPHTLRLEARCNLLATEAWSTGQVEIQDLGSQRVVEAAFAQLAPGAHVLDLCAGAGGKALALAALGCHVSAWDVRPQALMQLEKRARRCGLWGAGSSAGSIRVLSVEPKNDCRLNGREHFDLVLVDAPCSGTGVLRRHPENRWKLRFPLAAQLELLTRAMQMAPLTLYATCALSRAENSELVRRALGQLSSEGLARSGQNDTTTKATAACALEWERTLWPEAGGADGFYMALLSRPSSRVIF